MPTTNVCIKKEVKVLDLLSKKKQYIKSGVNKGKVKTKIKTPAKYKKVLNLLEISNIFKDSEIIVIESPAMSFGNSAKATATTNKNYGMILACAILSGAEVIPVPPHIWKKDLGLSKDKLESIEMAEKLYPESKFRKDNGTLLDGQAEAALIRYWYITYILGKEEK